MNMIPVSYREQIRASDCLEIRQIVTSTSSFSREEIEVAIELAQERLQRGAVSGYEFVFAEHEGRVTGYTCYGAIACTRASYDLYWIAVRDELRGAGIGKQLLQRTEELIRNSAGQRIYVETSSRMDYQPTRSFYERCGYRREALLADFYAPGDNKVIYVKVL